jgi:hypothetical protein
MATITTELIDTGAKRDGRGRRIMTVTERAALILAYRRSGLTQRAFAEREGIKYCTFTTWLQRRGNDKQPAHGEVRFAEVSMPAAATIVGLAVQLPDGVVIRGGSVSEIAELIRALRN